MANEFALFVEHEIKYTNSDPIPGEDIVNALQALIRIVDQYLPRTLNALADVEVWRAELLVEGFEHGSLKEKIIIKLVFGGEEQFNDFLKKLHEGKVSEAWGILPGGPRVKVTVVGLVLAVLVGAGLDHLLAHKTDVQQPPVTIIINVTADALNKSPDEVTKIVRDAVGAHTKQLAGDVAQFVAPAKNDPWGAVVMGGDERLSIPAETVHEIPRLSPVGFHQLATVGDMARPIEVRGLPHEWRIMQKDIELDIRASDRDSSKSGWWGVIPELSPKRIQLVLDEGVDASDLANRVRVRADVVITYKEGKSGRVRPTKALLVRVFPSVF